MLFVFIIQILILFFACSIEGKVILLTSQVLIFIYYIRYYKISWLSYIVCITFLRGLLILFTYLISTLNKNILYKKKRHFMYTFVICLFVFIFHDIDLTIDLFLWYGDNAEMSFFFKINNLTIVIITGVLLSVMLVGLSFIRNKTIKSLRVFFSG